MSQEFHVVCIIEMKLFVSLHQQWLVEINTCWEMNLRSKRNNDFGGYIFATTVDSG